MNSIALIIVTAFINIVITGIVSNLIFYRYQKKIEDSFAKSLFEHQVKYTRSYPKALQVLEILHPQLLKYRATAFRHANMFIASKLDLGEINSEEFGNSIDTFQSAKDEILSCYQENRIYLPEKSVLELGNKIRKVSGLYEFIPSLAYVPNMPTERFFGYVSARERVDGYKVDLGDLSPTATDFPYLYGKKICAEIELLVAQFEKHYKLVADLAKEK